MCSDTTRRRLVTTFETYGRHGETPIVFIFFTELPVPPQVTGVIGTLKSRFSQICLIFFGGRSMGR